MRSNIWFRLIPIITCAQACGGTSTSASARIAATPQNMYPSGDGYVWSYNVDTGTGVNSLGVTRIVEHSADGFVVHTGEAQLRYQYRPDGIFRPDSDTYLLQFPLEVGHSWRTTEARTAEIVSVTTNVETPAGAFRDCVLVRETGGDSGREIETTYCQDIGPVMVEVRQALRLTPDGMRVRGVLLGFVRGSEDE